MEVGTLILVGLLLMLSFVFSGMEAGVAALSRVRIRKWIRDGNERAAVLQGFLDHPEGFLWTILVGNTLVNFTAVALIVSRLYEWSHGSPGVFAALLLATGLVLYGAVELFPKLLFRQFPNRMCVALARPFRLVHLALSPLVRLMSGLSRQLLRWTEGRAFTGQFFGNREEIRWLMQESAENFTTDERQMISRALEMQGVTLRQIAVPLANVVSVGETQPLAEALRLARESGRSRLPVWRDSGTRRKIVGLLDLSTVLYEGALDVSQSVASSMSPAIYFQDDTRLEVALRRLQRGGGRLAIVLGPDRSERGVVSLQDLMKFIFGEVTL